MVLNFKFIFFQTHIFITLLVNFIEPCFGYGGRKYTKDDILKLREEVRDMFNHAYSGYLKYAYPYDELRPLTCDGVDTWGSYSLTLIDALDTLAVMGNFSEFRRVVDIVTSKANFDANINVSVFETNIRIVGGLLSAHLLSQRAGVVLEPGWPCNGPLLRLAEDVAKRLIAAFDTTTGMPYGTVNLRHGVPPGETSITCTAGVGTFILEFGTLTRLTGDPIYEEVALNALYALYHHRSSIGLYGNHIDVITGRWTAQDSGIGAGVDSYLEYLVKGALLVQRPELMAIFKEGRAAIDKHLKRNDWYLWVSMHKGQVTLPIFQSLEAYWPGVLSLIGDISDGMKSMHNYHQVWKQYGFTPEFYNIAQGQVGTNRESYPLRPELIESTMYLYRATKDPFLLDVGVDILRSIQHSAKTKCGYATIKDCRDHTLENRMESFFLAETTKYLYLLFDPDNFIHNDGSHGTVHTLPSGRECILDAGGYIFNTEAHPLDPGALMCCSENYHEPKPFSREKARGDKFKSFVKESGVNEGAAENSDNVNLVQSSEDDESLNLPSALIGTEPIPRRNFQFLDKLQENGAIDIVKVPVPSTEDPTENKLLHGRLSLNMLQMIETIINNNLEKHLYKTAWSHDLLKKLVGVIENAEKMLSKERNEIKNGNIDNSGNNDPSSDIIDSEEFVENQLLSNDIRDENISHQISDDIDQNEKSSLIAENYEHIPESALHLTNRTHLPPSSENNSLLHDKNNHKEYDTNLIELVIGQQFKTIKEAVLTESELVMFHLEKCIENLKLTKSLVEITNDEELKSKFVTARLKVMLLAHNVKRSVDETKKLITSEELLGSGKVILFKRLIELVIDGKTVKDFMDNYKNYIEIVNEIITMGKEKFEIEEESTKHRDEDSNINESEVNEGNENFSSEDTENVFSTNSWKTVDITYQVDDRERVSPVSKVNGGPLFTDKLRINTEEEVESIQNTRPTNETPFNPQALLERIREKPRYYRNVTWSTQYELLTCLPQPYFTRIMLSGEFFSD